MYESYKIKFWRCFKGTADHTICLPLFTAPRLLTRHDPSSSSLIDFVVFHLSKARKLFDNNPTWSNAIYAYHILSGILIEQSCEAL